MAAVTPTLIQYTNLPSSIAYGTAEKRLVQIYVEVTSTSTTDTLDLSTYVPNLQGIAGVSFNSLDSADASNDTTLNTWSGTTLTMAGHAGSGVWKLGIVGNY